MSPTPPSWPVAIAVDVGGTFTDLVVADAAGATWVAKVPSVRRDPSRGVLAAVHRVSEDLGVPAGELLGHCARFVHGSTIATNAVLESDLARVGLLTTAGFRDTLEIRRGIREDQWDHRAPWPEVLVPRHRRRPVRGRLGADGAEREPLCVEDVEAAAEAWQEDGVEAVAVCLLHSYADPAHEHAAADLLRRWWPGPATTASSDLVALLGEYERTSTAVVNAGLVPRVGAYLARLAEELVELGLAGPLLLLASNGGTVPVTAVSGRPVDLVLSGPAAVAGALQRLGRDEALVSMEIGGTSCDVAVMAGGAVPVVDGLTVGGRHLAVPAVDVHTVGAGGGTIAFVDDAGLLHVGPRGAGAEPGPACYGRGGTEATATDAHLLLGRLRPGPYAGGSVSLDAERAERAVEDHVARPLGLTVEAAAQGVMALLEQHLRQAVETITIERGRDPAAMTLVAAGGAGGLHGTSVARALGCRRVVVPAEAGVFCAFGMLHSDLRRDVARTVVFDPDDAGEVDLVGELRERQATAEKLAAEEWPAVEAEIRWQVDVRYPGQLWSVRVELGEPSEAVGSDEVRELFEAEYGRRYGHVQPGGRLEVTAVRAVITGRLPAPALPSPPPASGPPPVDHRRRCWLGVEAGWAEVPVHAGGSLAPGHVLDGPFLVEAATTTVLGLPGDRAAVGPSGDLVIDLGEVPPS